MAGVLLRFKRSDSLTGEECIAQRNAVNRVSLSKRSDDPDYSRYISFIFFYD